MKKNTLSTLAARKGELLEKWTSLLIENGADDGQTEEGESEEFASLFLEALQFGDFDAQAPAFDKVKELLIGIATSRGKRGFSPRENALYLFSFKQAAFHLLSESEKDSATLFRANLHLGNLLDEMAILTFEAFLKGREEIILRQTDEINEISTPVIKIWDGVVALPIIGTLDSSRTQVVMENLLQQIVETESSIAILDISGVPAVDSLVAQHLLKTVSATRLMGAECIISGIRPEIAQTMVHLGIDLEGIITKATLASALQTAFASMQLSVTRKVKIQ